MNILIEKERDSEENTRIKRDLLDQIAQVRNKLSKYKEIEAEIEVVAGLLKSKQKQLKPIKQQSPEKKPQRPSNINKKIKIYELQKKLKIKNKQRRDKELNYERLLRRQEEELQLIYDTRKELENQTTAWEKQNTLTESLLVDIHRIQEYRKQNIELLTNQKQILAMCSIEKTKKMMEIRRLKKYIRKQSEQTQPDESDIDQSVDDNSQQNKQGNKQKNDNHRFSSTSKGSSPKQSDRRFSQQMSNQKGENEVPIFNKLYIKQKDNKQYSGSKTFVNQNFAKLQNQVYQTQQKISKNSKLYDELLQCLSFIRRGNKNLQVSCKHSKVTSKLLQNRVEGTLMKNQEYCKQLLQNIAKGDTLFQKLKFKEGQRGELRGHLGIKVQNGRMLEIINEEIKFDLHKLREKVHRLKDLEMQCRTTIHKLMNGSSIMEHNSSTPEQY